MKLVLCNGVFDLLHEGHIEHLQEARTMGDFLIVSLTLDEYVNKGPKRPVYKWNQRANILREMKCVDEVVPSVRAVDAILHYRPHTFVKGSDYKDGGWTEDIVEACKVAGAELRFTVAQKQSTTATIRKMQIPSMGAIMWQRTKQSLPPTGEVLAVGRQIVRNGEWLDEDATWDGERWKRRNDGQTFEKEHYLIWRRLET